jgi:hypothetical protein
VGAPPPALAAASPPRVRGAGRGRAGPSGRACPGSTRSSGAHAAAWQASTRATFSGTHSTRGLPLESAHSPGLPVQKASSHLLANGTKAPQPPHAWSATPGSCRRMADIRPTLPLPSARPGPCSWCSSSAAAWSSQIACLSGMMLQMPCNSVVRACGPTCRGMVPASMGGLRTRGTRLWASAPPARRCGRREATSVAGRTDLPSPCHGEGLRGCAVSSCAGWLTRKGRRKAARSGRAGVRVTKGAATVEERG